jgi:hypothetical protein
LVTTCFEHCTVRAEGLHVDWPVALVQQKNCLMMMVVVVMVVMMH